MFDRRDKSQHEGNSTSEIESDENSSSNEVSDSGEESVKSYAKSSPQKYAYPSIMEKYGREPTVSSRCATLVMEEEDEVKKRTMGPSIRRELAKIRYVTAEEYLKRYGQDGLYSHLAGALCCQGSMPDDEEMM